MISDMEGNVVLSAVRYVFHAGYKTDYVFDSIFLYS